MASAIQLCPVRSLLLPFARVFGKCRHHLEKQSCIPRFRQSDIVIRAYICSVHLHRYTVCHLYCKHFRCLTYSVSLRHFYPNAQARFPALAKVPYLQPVQALLLSSAICEYAFRGSSNLSSLLK